MLSYVLVSIAVGLIVFHEYQVHNALSQKAIEDLKAQIEKAPEFNF